MFFQGKNSRYNVNLFLTALQHLEGNDKQAKVSIMNA